jgi:hypothetical protein
VYDIFVKRIITIDDLTAEACYCAHEDWWEDKPINANTAKSIDDFIKRCPRALWGLNIGCAHYYMQELKWVDWLFVEHLRGHEEKERLHKQYMDLHQLKRYLDQLTRLAKWVSLNAVDGLEYTDDPRLAASVEVLSLDDPLRQLFDEIVTCTNPIKKTGLLHRADDSIIERMNDLLSYIREIRPNIVAEPQEGVPVTSFWAVSDDEL